MKRCLLFVLCLVISLLSGCAAVPQAPQATETPQAGATIISGEAGTLTPSPATDRIVVPPAGTKIALPGIEKGGPASPVYLELAELVPGEDDTARPELLLSGSLPTPCHTLQVSVQPPDGEGRIDVAVFSQSKPGAVCTQVLKLFEERVQFASLEAGSYQVWVNGEEVGTMMVP